MAPRVTYRRKHTYRTRSNTVKKFRTPGKLITPYNLLYRRKAFSPIHKKKSCPKSMW